MNTHSTRSGDDAFDAHELLASLAPARLPSAAEIADARQRLQARRAHVTGVTRSDPEFQTKRMMSRIDRIPTPWRFAASGIAAAVALTLVIAFTPEGGSAAAAFLANFRSQQVTAIEVGPQSQGEIIRTLNALGNLGTVQTPNGLNGTRPSDVARAAEGQSKTLSIADAAKAVPFKLVTPDPSTLPSDVANTPQVRVITGSQVKFTFDKKKAQAYFQANGHPEVNLPDKFDGASLLVSIPTAAVLEYGQLDRTPSQSQAGKNAVIIGEAGEVVVDAQGGVSLQEMRDFLLGLPGLPSDVVDQLKKIDNWNDTLPIPIPAGHVQWANQNIGGSQGLLLKDNSGVGSAAMWHDSAGRLMGVAGTLKSDQVLKIADSLH